MQTVQVTISGVFQNTAALKGCIRFRLSAPAVVGDVYVVPQEWQEIAFDDTGKAVAELIPNRLISDNSYYDWQVLLKEAGVELSEKAERRLLVQEGQCVVPDYDCVFTNIAICEPIYVDPMEAGKAYANEAKSYAKQMQALIDGATDTITSAKDSAVADGVAALQKESAAQIDAIKTAGASRIAAVNAAGSEQLEACTTQATLAGTYAQNAALAQSEATAAKEAAEAARATVETLSAEIQANAQAAAQSAAEAATSAENAASSAAALSGSMEQVADSQRQLNIAKADIENLKAASEGTLYTVKTLAKEAYSYQVGASEDVGETGRVLPFAFVQSISGKTIVQDEELVSAGVTEIESTAESGDALGSITIPAAVQALPGYGWSAGTARNWVDFENRMYHREVASVDLWELDFAIFKALETGWIALGIPSGKKNGGLVCEKYASVQYINSSGIIGINNKISTDGYVYINLKGSSYETKEEAMADLASKAPITVYYELDTPELIDMSDLLPEDFNVIPVQHGGTVTFKNQNGLPVGSEVSYMVKKTA